MPMQEAPQPRPHEDLHRLSEAQRTLVVELRAMRERAGLSLVELGRVTNYSKSSWERWLNGKRPVPLPAVIALANACGQNPSRLIGAALATESAVDSPPAADHDQATRADPAEGVGGKPHGSTSWVKATVDRFGPRSKPGRLVGALAVGIMAGALVAGVALAARPSTTIRLGTAGPAPQLGCEADSCRGLDPEHSHCADDAQTVDFDQGPELTVNLRYSAACQAAWGQIIAARPGDTVAIYDLDGTAQTAKVSFGTDVYTPMLPVRNPAMLKVCGYHDTQAVACTASQSTNTQHDPTTTAGKPR